MAEPAAALPGARILPRLAPAVLDGAEPGELMELVATIWTDVELASLLYGSEAFFRERLMHFGKRGYMTPREEEGTRKLLAEYGKRLRARVEGAPPR